MAKLKNKQPQQAILESGEQHPFTIGINIPAWLAGFKIQAVIIALLAIAFYINTYKNQYALDDTSVIVMNEFVHQGFAGIPDILSKDVYYSYYRQLHTSDQVPGGRYRPLSVVTFALEDQLFGPVPVNGVDSIIANGLGYDMQLPYEKKFLKLMSFRHIGNVILYALLAVVLLCFFRYVIFKSQPLMSFVGAIIFTIHPLHTEVVANVKSRDEIMSLLFICVTFIFAFRYQEFKKTRQLVAALCCYLLAFLSKEYAVTLVILLPLSFYLISKYPLRKSIIASLPYLALAAVYVLFRLQIMGPRSEMADSDIQINPYAWATHIEKIASEIATSLNYLRLLLFPHSLSSDYSYNQIPYSDFSSPVVWLSLIIHLSLAGGFFYFIKRKPLLSFAIGFYLVNLLMINNFIFDIGATMGERLIFHASAGFAIAAAYLLVKGAEQIKMPVSRQAALGSVMGLLIVLCGFKTINRNKDWKNDESLFFKDINASPNSFLVNVNVATMLVNRSDFEKDERVRVANVQRALGLYTKVIGMQDNYVLGYMNRCVAYYKLGMTDSMVADLGRVLKLYPIHPQLPDLYYRAGMLYFAHKQYEQASKVMHICLQLTPRDPLVTKTIHDIDSAMGKSVGGAADNVQGSNVSVK